MQAIPNDNDRFVIRDAERGCFVQYVEHFLARSDADELFKILLAETPFQKEAPIMFGRPVEVRRRTYSYGDPGIRYRYARIERVAAPWHGVVLPLLDRLEERTGTRFNYALCNFYLDGEAGIGWHADDERDIETGSTIASLSLGAARDFQVRLGKKGPTCATVTLGHGSLLMMGGATQAHYQHQVPKRAGVTTPRINLTFRLMRSSRTRS